ncbi:MAG: LysR substrate-binding domain-containing protein [Bryobacteraceae bacterium]
MNLQELTYFVSVADHLHFGRAASACHVGQPALSAQLRKLEHELGVTLFERTNRRVAITPAGRQLLEHARRVIGEVGQLEAAAAAFEDQLSAPLKLGAIPTIAPYLMPLILGPLGDAHPRLRIELWEDITTNLLDRLRTQKLDAALIATEVDEHGLTALALFNEPFLAALPPGHRLAHDRPVREADLATDLLVLADGHCLAGQARAVCEGRASNPRQADLRASSLETLVNLVAAGYGATLIPQLAAANLTGRGVILRPLAGRSFRTIRLASRATFPRPKALQAVARTIDSNRPRNPAAAG